MLLEFFEHGFHLLGGRHVEELAPNLGHLVVICLAQEEFLLARAALGEIHRRPDAHVGQFTREDEFHVAGALELLKDEVVHAAAGLDQHRGDDRQAAAVLDLSRRAEHLLGVLQRPNVEAAGHRSPTGTDEIVEGATEAGERIEQDEHVFAELQMALGLLDHHAADAAVALGVVIVAGIDDLGGTVLPAAAFLADDPLHLRNFLGPLVDEQHHQEDLGMILANALGHLLEQDGLAGARRRDDEAALSLADGGEQIDDPRGHRAALGLEAKLFRRVYDGQILERLQGCILRRRQTADRLDAIDERRALALLAAIQGGRQRLAAAKLEPREDIAIDLWVVGTDGIVSARVAQVAAAAFFTHFERAGHGVVGIIHQTDIPCCAITIARRVRPRVIRRPDSSILDCVRKLERVRRKNPARDLLPRCVTQWGQPPSTGATVVPGEPRQGPACRSVVNDVRRIRRTHPSPRSSGTVHRECCRASPNAVPPEIAQLPPDLPR